MSPTRVTALTAVHKRRYRLELGLGLLALLPLAACVSTRDEPPKNPPPSVPSIAPVASAPAAPRLAKLPVPRSANARARPAPSSAGSVPGPQVECRLGGQNGLCTDDVDCSFYQRVCQAAAVAALILAFGNEAIPKDIVSKCVNGTCENQLPRAAERGRAP